MIQLILLLLIGLSHSHLTRVQDISTISVKSQDSSINSNKNQPSTSQKHFKIGLYKQKKLVIKAYKKKIPKKVKQKKQSIKQSKYTKYENQTSIHTSKEKPNQLTENQQLNTTDLKNSSFQFSMQDVENMLEKHAKVDENILQQSKPIIEISNSDNQGKISYGDSKFGILVNSKAKEEKKEDPFHYGSTLK